MLNNLGSPPQVRGKPEKGELAAGACGITPAGAGKTMCGDRSNLAVGDHPRRCGENLSIHAQFHDPPGITPAGAGKTLFVYTVLS